MKLLHPLPGAARILPVLFLAACSQESEEITTVRLVDLFAEARLTPTSQEQAPALPPVLWDFAASDGGKPDSSDREYFWNEGRNIKNLRAVNGRLSGRTANDLALVHLERTAGLDSDDLIHSFEIRLRVSEGTQLSLTTEREEKIEFDELLEIQDRPPFIFNSPVVAGDEFRTYTVLTRDNPFVPSLRASSARHLVINPTEVAGATFEIESVRLVLRREHLAKIPSGVSWQGLSNIFRETIVTRAPEIARFEVDVPREGWLDLALGSLDNAPLRFEITALDPSGGEIARLRRTLTEANRWQEVALDLSAAGRERVTLELALRDAPPGTLGFWGAPALRSRAVRTSAGVVEPGRSSPNAAGPVPQGVLVILADTLRRDHLDLYGHHRETAPNLSRFASGGVVFEDNIAQGSWTKVSVPSLLTSLYPTTLGIVEFTDRVPAAATTLAEIFREAGYATWASSSVPFSGQLSNLHQGYEVLHERASLDIPEGHRSKTARAWVDRLLVFLERHRETPFFAFLHLMDPHDPYEPYPPYNDLWAEADARTRHEERVEKVREHIKDPTNKIRGLPTRDELIQAGIDPEAFVRTEKDWYDGSTRAMDAELGRLFERLEELGLDERVLVVVLSDHGEEFLDHGQHFHENDVYGEMINVPLAVRWPGKISAGRSVSETVENLDVMPTLLELAHLPIPEGLQGQSLVPLLGLEKSNGASAAPSWRPQPAIAEWTRRRDQQDDGGVDQRSIIQDGWKLIQNVARPEGRAEFELYDHAKDPLNQVDLAAENPEIVESMAAKLESWHRSALEARLEDDEALEDLSAEELERLRSLGYIQ